MQSPMPQTSPRAISRTLPSRSKPPPPMKLDPATPPHILLPVSRLPHYTPSVSSVSIAQALEAYNNSVEHWSPKSRHSVGKLTRSSRSPAVSVTAIDTLVNVPSASSAGATAVDSPRGTISPSGSLRHFTLSPETTSQPSWVKEFLGDFEIAEDNVELAGFQLYAVEKWVVQRTKLLTSIVVYTGDEKDKVYVTVLRPSAALSEPEQYSELDAVVQKFRQDGGARPREVTGKGVIMTTLLPNFRPDLTIVHIPDGSFRKAQEHLYANIGLLRMGCTGRSALTLEEPYESAKEKFAQMYHFPEYITQCTGVPASTPTKQPTSPLPRSPAGSLHGGSPFVSKGSSSLKAPKPHNKQHNALPSFSTVVLNFVKVIQSALSLFAMFDVAEEERDGLLCDVTVEGIRRCINELSKLVDIEPTERALDPSAVAAILSSVISTRNKLLALGIGTHSKDPFMDPSVFIESVITFQKTFNKHRHSASADSTHRSPQYTSSTSQQQTIQPFLSYELMQRIDAIYTSKVRSPEPYKVHRVLKHKLDDSLAAATNFSENLASNISGGLRTTASVLTGSTTVEGAGAPTTSEHVQALSSLDCPITDLETLVKMVIGGSPRSSSFKESIDSLRYVWTAQKNAGVREMERRIRGREMLEEQRERMREWDFGRRKEREKERDGKVKSDGEDGAASITNWGKDTASKIFGSSFVDIGLGKSRKSLDVLSDPEREANVLKSHKTLPSLRVTEASHSNLPSMVPSPVRDTMSPPSSVYPSPQHAASQLPSASHMFQGASDTDGRFNDQGLIRRSSIAVLDNDPQWRSMRRRLNLTDQMDQDYQDESEEGEDAEVYGKAIAEDTMPSIDWWIRKPVKKKRISDLERRHSFSCCSEYVGQHVLTPERMKADVDLCSAYFTLIEKQEDMDRIILLLQSLLDSTKRTNNSLGKKFLDLEFAYHEIDPKALELNQSARQSRAAVDEAVKVANQLDYRMTEVERGERQLGLTLTEYRRRTTDAMVTAAAEGANELLDLEDEQKDDAGSASVDGASRTSTPAPGHVTFDDPGLRQRHPSRINPQ